MIQYSPGSLISQPAQEGGRGGLWGVGRIRKKEDI